VCQFRGACRHVLWELPQVNLTIKDLERLLQARFGTQLQAESFKAKLRNRRRAKGETLQDLYRDISRLIQLAHPSEGDKLVKYIGVESFVRALDDRYLRLEILKLRPADLEEAASHAIRLEALMDSVDGKTTDSSDQGGRRSSAHPRTVFAVADNKPEKDSDTDLLKRVKRLEKELKQAHKGSKDSSSKKASAKRSGGRNSAGRGDSASASGDGTRVSPDNRPCFLCKELGH